MRLGVKKPDDPTILKTIAVVDQQLAVDTPNGRFWHRANFDGYGEQLNGEPWNSFPADSRSIEAGRPVEQPSIVACRYARSCG